MPCTCLAELTIDSIWDNHQLTTQPYRILASTLPGYQDDKPKFQKPEYQINWTD